MFSDFKFAFRSLLKSPGFTAVAVLTLALGIGANTAIFSYVHALLLRPLPFPNQERLVHVYGAVKREGWERRAFSQPDFRDYRAQATAQFAELAAYSAESETLSLQGASPERVRTELVTANYFRALGFNASIGRVFLPSEDNAPGQAAVAVIGESLWRGKFGGDPSVLGRTLQLNERNYTIVGIMPAGFRGVSGDIDLWLPMTMVTQVIAPEAWTSRGWHWHQAIGLLKPGVALAQAQSELNAIGATIAQAHPDDSKNYGAVATTLREELVGDLRQPMLIVLGAVAVVLLITCVNVAHLLLVRLNSRRSELSIRAALGAARGQLARLFLAEAALLGFTGGALALLCSFWSIDALRWIAPRQMPQFADVHLSWPVFLFAAGIALLCTLAVGLLPVWEVSRRDLASGVKDSSRGAIGSASGQRARNGLMIAEIALALTLLAGAGLMLRSYGNLSHVQPGFRTAGVFTASFELPATRYDAPKIAAFHTQLLERLRALPGVRTAALAYDTPLDGNTSAIFATVDRPAPDPADNELRAFTHDVSSDFFTAYGIKLLAGEFFSPSLRADGEKVVLVSESFAKRFWPAGNAIGQRFKNGRHASDSPWMRIIGVVADTKARRLPENPSRDPDFYAPLVQNTDSFCNLVLQTETAGAAPLTEVRSVMQSLDPAIAVFGASTIEQRIASRTANPRFTMQLISLFAVVALVLACIGIYGVVSFDVGLRTREIGIRQALGAQRHDVLRLILVSTARIVALGLATGTALSLVLSRTLQGLLYKVTPADPLVYAAGLLLLSAVALLACYLPARRATKVDPMVALRSE